MPPSLTLKVLEDISPIRAAHITLYLSQLPLRPLHKNLVPVVATSASPADRQILRITLKANLAVNNFATVKMLAEVVLRNFHVILTLTDLTDPSAGR